MSKTCIKCKTNNKDDAEFCIKCGSTFKDVKSKDTVNSQIDDKIGVEEENKNQSGKSNEFENINSDKIIKSKKKSKKRKISILIILGIVIVLVVCAFAGVFDTRETVTIADGSTFKVPTGFEFNQTLSDKMGDAVLIPDSNIPNTYILVGLQSGVDLKVDQIFSQNTYNLNGFYVREHKCLASGDVYQYNYFFEKEGNKYFIAYLCDKGPTEVNFKDSSNPARQVFDSFKAY